MVVIEESQVPDVALPVAELRRHLRLGTGFGEDDVQDAVLTSFLRAALAAVEARTGKVLMQRDFVMVLEAWRDDAGEALPVSPVSALTGLRLVMRDGGSVDADPAVYRLVRDDTVPRIAPMGFALPTVPPGGTVEVRFTAGYGPGFADLPADLAQAVLLLAAHYYEYRDETALAEGCMPFGVTSLIARYRRLGLGAPR
ncbi:MAG: head-tail connector protein [Roseivivax sp.]|nr:head-tail connector protein [Roseivivax sp.]